MTVFDDSSEDRWVDDRAGPVVRPFAVTRGRARPSAGKFDLISLVTAIRDTPFREPGLGPEHHAIIKFCRRAQSVAEISSHLDLPVGTIRVLLGDLLERRLVQVREPLSPAVFPDDSLLEEVLNGLRVL
jgi:hypothetical protein